MNNAVGYFPIVALIPIIFYIVSIVFIVWFAITLVKTQKEKNQTLREISISLKEFINNKED